MNNKEQKEKKEIEIADIDDSSDIEIQKKLDASKAQYPLWRAQRNGQTLTGHIHEVLTFQDLNGKGKHGILYNINTQSEKFPIVSIWLNTVLQSTFKRISDYKPINSDSFDEITKCHTDNIGKLIAIRFEGKVQPQTKGFKEYDNYTVTIIQ